jgi:hypothetical protein
MANDRASDGASDRASNETSNEASDRHGTSDGASDRASDRANEGQASGQGVWASTADPVSVAATTSKLAPTSRLLRGLGERIVVVRLISTAPAMYE